MLGRSDELLIVPQNLYEFWVVATRPTSVNGLGFTAAQADLDLARLTGPFTLLSEIPAIYSEWRQLVTTHNILGKNAHDAHLVAAMLVHGVSNLLTFNDQDFARFTSISVWTPAMILSPPSTP